MKNQEKILQKVSILFRSTFLKMEIAPVPIKELGLSFNVFKLTYIYL